MKLTGRDLLKLRWPLLGTLLLFAAGGLLAWWSRIDARQAAQEHHAAAARKNQIEQRLRQVRTEELELRERTLIFQRLERSGVTGEEKRLDWTEMLRDIQHELRIPGVKYEFGVQVPLDNVSGAAYAYFASPLRLQLRLLHEEDLLNFLARVQQDAKAMVFVRSCKLSPLARGGDGRESPAQLAAECEMQWVTLRRSTGKR